MDAIKTIVNIVLVGQFNPDKFMPKSLAEAKMIEEQEFDTASFITLLPSECVHFSLPWAEIRVLKNQFVITSLEEPNIRILDFIMRALKEVDPKSVVSQLGINCTAHYQMANMDKKNELGIKLAPTSAWGSWGKEINLSMEGQYKGTSWQGGVTNINMRLPFECGDVNGFRSITVQSSDLSVEGVMFFANHHHQTYLPNDIKIEKPKLSSEESTLVLLKTLSNSFEESVDKSMSIFQEVLET